MRKPVGNSYTPYSSPYHISQLVLVLLRETFSSIGNDSYVYKYTDNFNTTGVVIDTTFNKESGLYGKKPAIIVSRGGVSTQPFVMGDLADKSVKTFNSSKSTLLHSSVELRIIDKSSTAVDILSCEVFNFLCMCRTLLPEQTGVLACNSVNLSPVAPFQQDDNMYYCAASLGYAMQVHWKHLVPQITLKSIDYYNGNERNFLTSK